MGGNNIQNPDPEVSTEVEGDTRKEILEEDNLWHQNHRDKTKEGGCGGHNLAQGVEGDSVENLSWEEGDKDNGVEGDRETYGVEENSKGELILEVSENGKRGVIANSRALTPGSPTSVFKKLMGEKVPKLLTQKNRVSKSVKRERSNSVGNQH